MPQGGPWALLRDHLVGRLPLSPNTIDDMLARGEFVDEQGDAVAPDAPFVPRTVVWVHRDLAPEVPVPFDLTVLEQHERFVVVDKPHFLATMPRGRHIAETALTRLRRDLDLPRLTPAHRLDRLTAGVLLFTTEQRWRRPYQDVFAHRQAIKTYLAVLDAPRGLQLPAERHTRLVKPRGALQATEVAGEPNTHTSFLVLERTAHPTQADREQLLVRLTPTTGKTHQLRVHCAALGAPISGDPLYPTVREAADDLGDFSTPLQLLAEEIAFTDPIDGAARMYRSRRTLALAVGPEPAT